jgi:hypothetical protein
MNFNRQVKTFCNPCKCGSTKIKGVKDKDIICNKWIKTYTIICSICGNKYYKSGSDRVAIQGWNKKNSGESRIKKEGMKVFKRKGM